MQNINTTIILSSILLYIGNALKTIPSEIWKLIKTRFGVSISCDTIFNIGFYNIIDQWLVSLNKKSLINHYTLSERFDYKLEKWIQVHSIGEGSYAFINNNNLFIVNKYKEKSDSTNGSLLSYNFNIYIFGFGAKKIKQNLENNIIKDSNYEDKICIVYPEGPNKYIQKRDFNSIIVKNKDILISFLDNWNKNKDVYKKHNIFHTGILLYGPSGTGKSSLIKCIATYLNIKVAIIDLSTNINALATRLEQIEENTIVVFEDIDCIMNIDRANSKDKEENIKRAKLQLILNILDGITTPYDCVFIATTNYIDQLDEALIRPGRFDLKFEVGYFDEEEAKQMCDLFECDYSILDNIQFPIKPSELQTLCIGKLLGSNTIK